jgi:uncharacterized protein YdaU (DUF1376 family)
MRGRRSGSDFGGTGRASGARREKRDVFMPLAIGDYQRDTPHFTTRQHGAYFLLLMAGWVYGGRLAMTDEQLRTITRLDPAEWEEDRPVLVAKYEVGPDGAWIHRGMQRRMLALSMPIDAGIGVPGTLSAAEVGDDPYRHASLDPAERAKKVAAARKRWDARRDRRDAQLDAKTDAQSHAQSASGDAQTDAQSASESESIKNHQPPRLDVARGSVPLGEGGGLVDELLRIFNNPSFTNAAALGDCIREWRGLGLSDDAICIEVQQVTDAKRAKDDAWVPMHPSYFSKALHRCADAKGDANADAKLIVADPWEARVTAYAKARAAGAPGFWLDEWEGRPDGAVPNPAIAQAILIKHGFNQRAA